MCKSRICFYCGSTKVVKNGKTYYVKQRFKCHDCHRQYVANRTFKTLSNSEKELIGDLLETYWRLIGDLLVERISLEGICRVLKISAYHIYTYMDELYQEIPSDLYVSYMFQNFCPLHKTLIYNVLNVRMMKPGLLLVIKATNSGFGWRCIVRVV